jgi:hypothetical protein
MKHRLPFFLALSFFVQVNGFADTGSVLLGQTLNQPEHGEGNGKLRVTEYGILMKNPGFGFAVVYENNIPVVALTETVKVAKPNPIKMNPGKVISVIDPHLGTNEAIATSEDAEGFFCNDPNQPSQFYVSVIRSSDMKDGNRFKPLRAWKANFKDKSHQVVVTPASLSCYFELEAD